MALPIVPNVEFNFTSIMYTYLPWLVYLSSRTIEQYENQKVFGGGGGQKRQLSPCALFQVVTGAQEIGVFFAQAVTGGTGVNGLN